MKKEKKSYRSPLETIWGKILIIIICIAMIGGTLAGLIYLLVQNFGQV